MGRAARVTTAVFAALAAFVFKRGNAPADWTAIDEHLRRSWGALRSALHG